MSDSAEIEIRKQRHAVWPEYTVWIAFVYLPPEERPVQRSIHNGMTASRVMVEPSSYDWSYAAIGLNEDEARGWARKWLREREHAADRRSFAYPPPGGG